MIFTISIGIGAFLLILVGTYKKILLVLSLVPELRQQFHKLINGKSQTKRDQKSNLLYLQPDNIEKFNSSLLKIDTTFHKDIHTYYIEYITINSYSENIYSVNPLYLIIRKVDGHIECKKNGSNYLVFGSTDENKEVLKKYAELLDGIKN